MRQSKHYSYQQRNNVMETTESPTQCEMQPELTKRWNHREELVDMENNYKCAVTQNLNAAYSHHFNRSEQGQAAFYDRETEMNLQMAALSKCTCGKN